MEAGAKSISAKRPLRGASGQAAEHRARNMNNQFDFAHGSYIARNDEQRRYLVHSEKYINDMERGRKASIRVPSKIRDQTRSQIVLN